MINLNNEISKEYKEISLDISKISPHLENNKSSNINITDISPINLNYSPNNKNNKNKDKLGEENHNNVDNMSLSSKKNKEKNYVKKNIGNVSNLSNNASFESKYNSELNKSPVTNKIYGLKNKEKLKDKNVNKFNDRFFKSLRKTDSNMKSLNESLNLKNIQYKRYPI